jgi:hypothetical protein
VPNVDDDAVLRKRRNPRLSVCLVAVDERAVNVEQHG